MPLADESLTQAVKAKAYRLGFALCGVTTPDPPPHWEAFQRWITAGRQGEMSYLATERSLQRRADPRQILPECRSILVLGMRYPAPLEISSGHRLEGQVAAYAWGKDYHEVFPPLLQELMSFIEAQVGAPFPNRWYSDTGPVLERDLAQRAGLGWIGKHTCLIHPRQGSYFLLAELLLGVDLKPDEPFLADRCGACTRCLDACPSRCILPDRTLDARRCISYLTIELKSEVPLELRSKIGNWVFGCDICQQVCPWNQRFALPDGDPALNAQQAVWKVGMAIELTVTVEAFNQRFKFSPLRRAKRRGFLRNIVIALGNGLVDKNRSGRRDIDQEWELAVQSLAQVISQEPEPLVRAHAAWALGRAGGEAARSALAHAAEVETDPAVLSEIERALDAFP